jgi:hypothetical protein
MFLNLIIKQINHIKMKIEIELSELEEIRSDLKKAEEQKKQLQEKLNGLSEEELKAKAVRLSYRLFDNYMAAVFKHLGFEEDWQRDSVIVKDNLEHWIGKDWWNSDRISVELCATVTTQFKSAFIRIGILPKEVELKNDTHELV